MEPVQLVLLINRLLSILVEIAAQQMEDWWNWVQKYMGIEKFSKENKNNFSPSLADRVYVLNSIEFMFLKSETLRIVLKSNIKRLKWG